MLIATLRTRETILKMFILWIHNIPSSDCVHFPASVFVTNPTAFGSQWICGSWAVTNTIVNNTHNFRWTHAVGFLHTLEDWSKAHRKPHCFSASFSKSLDLLKRDNFVICKRQNNEYTSAMGGHGLWGVHSLCGKLFSKSIRKDNSHMNGQKIN